MNSKEYFQDRIIIELNREGWERLIRTNRINLYLKEVNGINHLEEVNGINHLEEEGERDKPSRVYKFLSD